MKTIIDFEGSRCLIEQPIKADFALLHAEKADSFGNLMYAASGQNFNPLMAMAADFVLAEAEELSAPGALSPDAIHTPGPFVDCVVHVPELTKDYCVVQR